jgi:hypothetical protein
MNMADALSRLTEAAEEAEREEHQEKTAQASRKKARSQDNAQAETNGQRLASIRTWAAYRRATSKLDELYESEADEEISPMNLTEQEAPTKRVRKQTKRDSIQYKGSSYDNKQSNNGEPAIEEAYKEKKKMDESRPDYEVENSAKLMAPEIQEVRPLPMPDAIAKAQKKEAKASKLIKILQQEPTKPREKWTKVEREVNQRYVLKRVAEGQPRLLHCRRGKSNAEGEVIPSTVVYIPAEAKALQDRILSYLHNSMFAVHPGVKATEQAVRQRYYWPNIRAAVEKHVGSCVRCASSKGTNPKSGGYLQQYSHQEQAIQSA